MLAVVGRKKWKVLKSILHLLRNTDEISDTYSELTANVNLGIQLVNLAKYNEAEKNLLAAENLVGQLYPGNSWEYANLLGNFGFLYAAWGKYEKAIEYSNSALKMFEVCCKDSIRKSLFIGNLAEYYFEVGRIADAEDAFLNALSTRENYFGKDHPGLYDLLINIGKFYLNLKTSLLQKNIQKELIRSIPNS